VAIIERHPALNDCFVELTLPEISSRNGIAEIFETGRLIVLKDYRLDFDFSALAHLNKSTERIEDRELRRKLKKLTALHFFEGEKPVARRGKLFFADPVRQAVFDVLCRGDRDVFEQAAGALKRAHDELHRIFRICFPNYEVFRLVPSVRLTQTLFENLHWDNHSIDDDFHQARIFANLDVRPRLWNIGRGFTDWVRKFYKEHDLGRFAGKDPNLMIAYITGEVLGGTRNSWMDREPRHRIAFEPGEVWLGESRLVSHQIYYGEAAMVYMWFVDPASMSAPSNRFNEQVEQVHREMREKEADAT
jgi:hypothetical protein